MGQHGKQLICQTVDILKAHGLHLVQQLHQNLPLPLRPLVIGISHLPDTGICNRLHTVTFIGSFPRDQIIVLIQSQDPALLADTFVGILRLFLREGDFNGSDGINDINHISKIHRHIPVHLHLVIFRDGFAQQRTGSVGIGGVQLPVTHAGDIHIGITHQRNHTDLLQPVIDGYQNHGI